jgi:hypothetical protein
MRVLLQALERAMCMVGRAVLQLIGQTDQTERKLGAASASGDQGKTLPPTWSDTSLVGSGPSSQLPSNVRGGHVGGGHWRGFRVRGVLEFRVNEACAAPSSVFRRVENVDQ